MKRFSLFALLLLLFCIPLPASPSQKTVSDNEGILEKALQRFFSDYTLPGFKPKLVIGLDDYELDEDAHTLDVYGNEGFSSQLFTPDINKAIYNRLRQSLPSPYNDYRLRLFAFGLEIDSLIPNLLQNNKHPERLWGSHNYTGNPWYENLSSPAGGTAT